MKFLPIKTDVRVNTEDSLGHGMDAVFMLVLFLGAGYGIDRVAGTTPLFMIVMTLLGSTGLFLKFKYSYEARMDELDAQRRNPSGRVVQATPTVTTQTQTQAQPEPVLGAATDSDHAA